MQKFELEAIVDDEGVLKLALPKGMANASVHVIVMTSEAFPTAEMDAMGYPIGYFEQAYGILRDEPMERGDQGTYEVRESIE